MEDKDLGARLIHQAIPEFAETLPRLNPAERVLSRIDPQPPRGIKYMLGDESWLPQEQRSPIRLECEEWGHLGPMVLDASIPPNAAGFRVRATTIPAPEGAKGFTRIDGVYYWTDMSVWDRMQHETEDAASPGTRGSVPSEAP